MSVPRANLCSTDDALTYKAADGVTDGAVGKPDPVRQMDGKTRDLNNTKVFRKINVFLKTFFVIM